MTEKEYQTRDSQLAEEANQRQLEYANITLNVSFFLKIFNYPVLQEFDTNSNHTLEISELTKYIESMYRDPTALPTVLPRFDKNNDSKLDLEGKIN